MPRLTRNRGLHRRQTDGEGRRHVQEQQASGEGRGEACRGWWLRWKLRLWWRQLWQWQPRHGQLLIWSRLSPGGQRSRAGDKKLL